MRAEVLLCCFFPCLQHQRQTMPQYIFWILLNCIVVQVQFSAFSPSPHPSHSHLPPLIPPALGFVHVCLIVVPENPSPFPHIIPPISHLVIVHLFLISMSLITSIHFYMNERTGIIGDIQRVMGRASWLEGIFSIDWLSYYIKNNQREHGKL